MDIVEHRDGEVNEQRRNWLAGKLRRKDVPSWLWDQLLENKGHELGDRDLLREARRRLRAIRPTPTSGVSAAPPEAAGVEQLLAPSEARRAWALSEYVASLAEADPDLKRFRDVHLDGRVLNEEDARLFLTSEALRFLPVDILRSEGVPLWQHTSTADDNSRPVQHVPRDPSKPPYPMWRNDVHIVVQWSGGSALFDPWQERSPGHAKDPTLDLPLGGGWHPFPVWSPSVYNELRLVRDRLMEQFPWNSPEATMFAVTGKPPFIPPIFVASSDPRIGTFGHMNFSITIEPWVSAQTVLRFYKHMKSLTYPKKSRALGEKNVALFRFVTRHARLGQEVPSYEELLTMWNEEHAEWRYDSAWMLARDYRRAGGLIIYPRYQGGGGGFRDRVP